MATELSEDAIKAIGSMQVDGQCAKIPYKVGRDLYVEINKALEAAGGQWSRKAKAHLWMAGTDVAEILDQIAMTGEYVDAKKEFSFFETPPALADEVVRLAEIADGMTLLEPSAGRGALVWAAHDGTPNNHVLIECCEIQPANQEHLRGLGLTVWEQPDFLQVIPVVLNQFDRVIMNPPFAKQADLDHVRHAFNFLKPGGRLVAIMSSGVAFRANRKTAEFREWMSHDPEIASGRMIQNADDAFAESGTNVRTVTLVLDRVKS